MFKPKQLAFLDQAEVEPVWERLPEQARMEVTQHYARLMTRALVWRIAALKANGEADDESSD